ncbi:SAM-dependent methyltransferase [Deinococcus sp.]|uniref:class I SAM-dependent methyltransferase n=1 Tax=Deinococcus sp. TaxID=47478 RepID=UPI0025C5AD8A|nr:SAM-dependent methyltransferase [Deinococcus sp.]
MTLPPEYFEHVYGNSDDPWNFESSPYEAAKYARTLAALPRPRYARALEVGCSIGVLTALLAQQAEHLTALDVNVQALERTRQRLEQAGLLSGVTLLQRRLPDELPPGPFDLVLLSEVLYYLGVDDLERALDAALVRLETGGTLLLVHWTPPVHDYPQTGDAVHEAALRRVAAGTLRHLKAQRHGDEQEGYRLDLFERC